MSLLRFLGLAPKERPGAGETETVRRIAARLERLDPATAKYLASFAYVLARVAQADLRIEESETQEMLRVVRTLAALSDEEAALVVEIAKSQARLLGGTENYVVTREFGRIASPEQRTALLQCLYAIAAADGSISNLEGTEILAIADELGFTRPEALALRSAWRDKLAVLRDLP
jgi:uncharacterized tellurite resistance protein B-like protein